MSGQPRTWGTVALRIDATEEVVATAPVGSLPGSPNGFLLVVPLDGHSPRRPGAAVAGDGAQLLLDGVVRGAIIVGARGGSQVADLSFSDPVDLLVVTQPPSAVPATVDSSGAIWLTVAVEDTQGHPVGYSWTADCAGPRNGRFDDPASRTPVWTAPIVLGAAADTCTLSVTAADGLGQTLTRTVDVTVRPTRVPEVPVPVVRAAPEPSLCGATIHFDGSDSFHGDPARQIVGWEWDFDYDEITFAKDADGALASHAYGNVASTFTAALRVTDDGTPARSAIGTVRVHAGGLNRPPLAAAGGPYTAKINAPLVLDASGSSDPDAPCGDAVAAYAWDLDNDGAFDDAAGAQPSVPWATVSAVVCGGVCVKGRLYPVAVRATDLAGASAAAASTVTPNLLVFEDLFSDGGAAGDPQWSVKSGKWTVVSSKTAKYYASKSATATNIAVPKAAAAGLTAGQIDALVSLPRLAQAAPNGALLFGYQLRTRYRYVQLSYAPTTASWWLTLGQVGAIGKDAAGVKATKKVTGPRLGLWNRLWVDFYPTGLVKVYLRVRGARPLLSYKFKGAAAGGVGVRAANAIAHFDTFRFWDKGALP